ncbi:alpha-hydroxy acid oxidase [Aristaeella lactis]|uniref:FMN-dependent dehydrogenase, includes L-lactate dehydrogenase and type II isopentenyl diphosphate isomerase n=1 Tax=Aristaeella lactis TaxID=3046383 RepID=A0AC61PQL1_9FIRM|nr:alpha-hydroxy acid oxidase [Aristaeella lactis]QUA52330.1 alpha-hydroxy-acid oxidizing protein [Aristaeella lactis]SMC91372.1 FMN-dependent dehydrogenase, includes L-lactate dehydrogenase and type II isopentenyl diphosphate isomerase [Aristaeella lactis]
MFSEAKGDSVQIAREYMDSLLVETRVVGAERPDTTFRFLGETFSTPVMTAALSHLDLVSMAAGAKQAGACVSIGMGGNGEMGEILATGAKVMKIIKPYADEKEILSRLEYAEENGALAVGMDVEHAVNTDDAEDSVVMGLQMKQPTLAELEKYIRHTKLPFFIKGALSVQDALRCRDLGAAGLVLSHHNGLTRFAVPPVMVLPEIRKAIGKDLLLIADGGIESGVDAFKALARGADAVTMGKALMGPLKENGADGVAETLRKATAQLQAMMIRTGTKNLKHMDPSVIWEPIGYRHG